MSFGVDGHAELPPLWVALADAAPPRWRCLTIVYGDGQALHLVADDDEAAVAWTLGLQRCAAARRAEAAAAGGGGGEEEAAEGSGTAGGEPAAPVECEAECALLWRRARLRVQQRAAAERRTVRSVVVEAVRGASGGTAWIDSAD